MTTKNEYIASIMLEAAELLKLDESAGANGAGARFYDEKIKKQEEKIRSLKKKADAYKRAGYSDKAPTKDYIKELNMLNRLNDLKKKFDSKSQNKSQADRMNAAKYSKNAGGEDTNDHRILEPYNKAFYKNAEKRKESEKKNARINKRAAMKEAIDLLYDKAMECDTLDEATEYIDKAEQLESLIGE